MLGFVLEKLTNLTDLLCQGGESLQNKISDWKPNVYMRSKTAPMSLITPDYYNCP